MSKYIIEIPDGVPYVLLRREDFGIAKVVPVAELEELNSDYINEHYGELQDAAYKRGYEKGRTVGIKDGMCDAWEAAKKIALMDTETSENVTGYFGLFRIMENLTPMQAIEKLKAYEEKQKAADEIKVGDEVTHKSDLATWKAVCIRIDGNGRYMNLMGYTGAVGYYPVDDFKKTGRHFDISGILEAMRNDLE